MDKINKAKTLFGYTCKKSEIFTAVRMWTKIQEFWFQKAFRWELYPFQTKFPRRQVPKSYHILRYKRRIKTPFTLRRSRGSSVSIVSDYGLDDRVIGVRSPAGAKDFSSSLCVQTGSEAHPAAYTMATGDPFPGAKRGQGRDADKSPPSIVEVKNE
jgi:hypothetical protein